MGHVVISRNAWRVSAQQIREYQQSIGGVKIEHSGVFKICSSCGERFEVRISPGRWEDRDYCYKQTCKKEVKQERKRRYMKGIRKKNWPVIPEPAEIDYDRLSDAIVSKIMPALVDRIMERMTAKQLVFELKE